MNQFSIVLNLSQLSRHLLRWIHDNEPVFCARCKKIVRRKNSKFELDRMGQLVPLCSECHNELFHPFSSRKP